MITVKDTQELDNTISHYSSYLSDVIDVMSDVPIYLKRQLKSSLEDMFEVYRKTGIPPKEISIDRNKDLKRDVTAIIFLLNEKIKLYLQSILASDIYSISDEVTDSNTSDSDKVDAMNAFINEDIDGKNTIDRIADYCKNFMYEAEAFIVAGIASDLSNDEISAEWVKYSNKPYNSELIKEAMRSNEFEATNIKSKGVTYGSGVSQSALLALALVGQDTAFRFYNRNLREAWLLNNTISGWISIRNSSFPCQLCDSQAYVFHPISELFQAWHRRCVCLCIPVTNNMI